VNALEVELTPQEDKSITQRSKDNISAYECYLKANRELQRLTETGVHRALRDLQNGLAVLGENADLYFGLGQAYLFTYDFGIDPSEETLQRVKECAGKVLELEPDSSRSHYLQGMLERSQGSVLKGIRHFERGLATDPDSRDILLWLSVCYAWEAGKASTGTLLAKRLLQIDPLTPTNYSVLGFSLWMNGRIDGAFAAFNRHHELEPESIIPRMWSVYILIWEGNYQEAFDLIDEITREKFPDVMHANFSELLRFSRFAVQGRKDQAIAALSDGVKHYCWVDPDLPWLMAGLYSAMKEKDEAFRWLKRAIDRGWINYPLFAEQDPLYENIRNDARFQKLMDRIRPEWERFEIGIDLSALPPANDD